MAASSFLLSFLLLFILNSEEYFFRPDRDFLKEWPTALLMLAHGAAGGG
jgi:hypothetical protein